eukprot:COSAG01_NODE_4667_length_4834_cov_23.607814_9_plen_50_part_01
MASACAWWLQRARTDLWLILGGEQSFGAPPPPPPPALSLFCFLRPGWWGA